MERASASFCRETHFGWQGTLANARGSENAAMIPRDLLPSRDRQTSELVRQEESSESLEKPAQDFHPISTAAAGVGLGAAGVGLGAFFCNAWRYRSSE